MKTTCAYDYWGNHIVAKPFGGLLAESDYVFQSTGSVYEVHKDNLHFIPSKPGVYIIIGYRSIYCGTGKNLNQRVPQSIKEQGFGERVIILNEENCSIQDRNESFLFWKELEKLCIQALSTIRAYNNLRTMLTNQKHRQPLPPMAWKDPENSPYKLPISIVQTGLSNFMPPNPAPHKTSPFEYTYRLWPINGHAIPDPTELERTIWAPRVVQALAYTYLEPLDDLSGYR